MLPWSELRRGARRCPEEGAEEEEEKRGIRMLSTTRPYIDIKEERKVEREREGTKVETREKERGRRGYNSRVWVLLAIEHETTNSPSGNQDEAANQDSCKGTSGDLLLFINSQLSLLGAILKIEQY